MLGEYQLKVILQDSIKKIVDFVRQTKESKPDSLDPDIEVVINRGYSDNNNSCIIKSEMGEVVVVSNMDQKTIKEEYEYRLLVKLAEARLRFSISFADDKKSVWKILSE